jgi:predicted outer membrane repeat protein
MKKKVMWTLILLMALMAVGSSGADTVSAATTPGIHQDVSTSASTYASRATTVAAKTTNAVATVTTTTVTGFKTALNSAKSGSTITLGSGTYNMNGVTISKNITLQGAGQNKTIFYGGGKRILTVGNVKVNINDIQFKGGSADYGGAIVNGGTLTLNNDFFNGNTATRYGGAINNNKVLTVNNCLFIGNKAPGTFEVGYGSGSGILNNRGCTLTVNKSRFTGNTAGSYGVIFQLGNGLISNSYFGTNTAGEGAAIFTSTGGNSQIISDVFENNKAISGAGGALDNYHAISTVTGCTFTGNSALRVGGAIYNDGQDVVNLTQSSFIVKNCTFTNNKAASGGGAIMTYAGTATVSDSTFNGNTAPNGGALYNYLGIFVLSNNVISGNTEPQIKQIMG